MKPVMAFACAAALLSGAGLQAAAVGSIAPPLEPSEWLNSKDTLTWGKLKGRVILVEKWATT